MSDGGPEREAIDGSLASRLVAGQFPEFANLPVRSVTRSGWDNRTFHLGDDYLLRFPSTADYVGQVAKEQRWLPRLAPQLPLPIPIPVRLGDATDEFPRAWSIYRRLPDEDLIAAPVDTNLLATDLGRFLAALYALPAADGPPPGAHNFMRGAHPEVYDGATRRALARLANPALATASEAIWEAALATRWSREPVWLHGDVAAGSLLQTESLLSAVIDFGCCSVGDPACDLAFAWTDLSGGARKTLLAGTGLDADTALRGAAWALWKALITWTRPGSGAAAEGPARVVRVIVDHYA